VLFWWADKCCSPRLGTRLPPASGCGCHVPGAAVGERGVLCLPIPPHHPRPRPAPCLWSVPRNTSESLKPLRPTLPTLRGARVCSRPAAASLSRAQGSAGGCQPRRAGRAHAPLVAAAEIQQIQTTRKINPSFMFLMATRQPGAFAFAVRLHPSIAARSRLPAPRGAGAGQPGATSRPRVAQGALGHIASRGASHRPAAAWNRPCSHGSPPAPPRLPRPRWRAQTGSAHGTDAPAERGRLRC